MTSCFVLWHHSRISFALIVPLHPTSTQCSGCWMLSKMLCSFDSIHLSDTTIREPSCNPDNVTGLAGEFVEFVGISYFQPAPASHTTQDHTGLHRFIKHPQHCPVDAKGPQPPKEVEVPSPVCYPCTLKIRKPRGELMWS